MADKSFYTHQFEAMHPPWTTHEREEWADYVSEGIREIWFALPLYERCVVISFYRSAVEYWKLGDDK